MSARPVRAPVVMPTRRSVVLAVAVLAMAGGTSHGQRTPAATFDRGMAHYRSGEYGQARARFLDAADAFEQSSEAGEQPRLHRLYSLSWAGLSAQGFGDLDAAAAHYEDALAIAEQLKNTDEISRLTSTVGMVAFQRGQWDRAAKAFSRSRDINRRTRNWEFLLHDLDNLVEVTRLAGSFTDSATYAQERIDLLRNLERPEEVAVAINNLGSMAVEFGRYADGIARYQEALELNQELGRIDEVAIQLANIGHAHQQWGDYGVARELFAKALGIARRQRMTELEAVLLNNIGERYRAWGLDRQAVALFEEAIEQETRVGRSDSLASLHNNLGQARRTLFEWEAAAEQYLLAERYARQQQDRSLLATILSNRGELMRQTGDLDGAATLYDAALAIDSVLGVPSRVVLRQNNLGLIQLARGNTEQAVEMFATALVPLQEAGELDDVGRIQHNLGEAYFELGQIDRAAAAFAEAVAAKEQLRLTARGAARRDYLASELSSYQSLALAYYAADDVGAAFEAIELSAAKYLADQLGERMRTAPTFAGLEEARASLAADDVLLRYANVGLPTTIVMLATPHGVAATTLDTETFIAEVEDAYADGLASYDRGEGSANTLAAARTRGAAAAGDAAALLSGRFDRVVAYFRSLLDRPALRRRDREARDGLAAALYRFLVEPLAAHGLENARRLIVIPDGVLSFLPFEVLRDNSGTYLVERFDVEYRQSLTVSQLIAERSHPADRQPLLALGGADYAAGGERVTNVLAADVAEARDSASRGGDVRGAIARLGRATWSQLPGSEEEAREVARITGGSLLTGAEASEAEIDRLSTSGQLRDYRVLHFATHGMVLPEAPELSALVLSHVPASVEAASGIDGYLTMAEIAELDLAADFVNLSACDTGLGRIYGGEGVVGLTQAFLVAGANSLSVSLWQVADEATSRFMTGVYRLVEEQGIGYGAAMAAMKRRFLEDERTARPFFWAPFVYYGA